MNKRYIYLFALLLLLSACRKEEVILDDPIVTTDPPTELDGFFVSGQITDNENALIEGAVVRFYQGGEQVGESTTDKEGFYDSSDIPLLQGEEITVAIEEEAYIAKYKRTDKEPETNQNINLRLVKKNGALPGQDEILKNPGDPSLVKMYGTFTDINGDPIVDAFTVLAWEFEVTIENSLKFDGVTDLTDENGYVELLVPAGEEVFFLSLPWYEGGADCTDYISEEEENILDWGLFFDNLGVITDEQEIIEKEGISLDAYNYLFYGDFQNCDGSPVSSGEGILRYSYVEDGDTIRRTARTTEFGPNGEYEFDLNLCGYGGDLDIELLLVNQDTFGKEVFIQDVTLGGIHFAPIKACDDFRQVIVTSVLNLNIGTDYSFNIEFDHPPFENSSSFVFIASHDDISGFIQFRMNDVVEGKNIIQILEVGFLSFGSNDPFKFVAFETISAEISNISNGEIIGTLQGNVETAELGTQEVTGDFVIRYE